MTCKCGLDGETHVQCQAFVLVVLNTNITQFMT